MDFEGVEQSEDVPSSGEEDAGDERKHNQLLDAISSLDGKKRNKLSQRTVLSNQISEFNFSSSKGEGSGVRLHELVGSLKESASHGELKNQLRNISRQSKTVSTPLPKHEKQKIERATAYETTTEILSKWDPIVQRNRRTDQLEFPLQKQDFRIVTTDQLVKRFQPRTPLERQVAELLQGSDSVVQNKEQELTPAEQRALQAMDVEEAKQRRMELMKYRALMSYKEAKAKRVKKIKSKRYHRILKKEKLKNENKQLDKLQQEDPEGYQEKLNQLEKDRAEERVSLKHRGGSKFAKRQMIYAKYDDRARQEVQDMLQKSRSLTKKTEVESDSEDDKFPDSGVDLDNTALSSVENTHNPWMAKPSAIKPKTAFSKPVELTNLENQEEDTPSDYSRPAEVVSEKVAAGSEDENSDSNDEDVEAIEEEIKTGINDEEWIPVSKKQSIEVHDLSGIDTRQVSNNTNSVNISSKVSNKIDEDKNYDSDDEVATIRENKTGSSDVSEEKIISSKVSSEIDNIFKKMQNTEKRKRTPRKKQMRNKDIAKGKKRKTSDKLTKETEIDTAKENKSDNDNEDDINDDSEEGIDNMSSNIDNKELDQDEEEMVMNNESVSRKRTMEDFEELLTEDIPEKTSPPKKLKTNRKSKKARKESAEQEKNVEKEAYVDPKKLFTLESKIRQVGSLPSVVETEDDDGVDTEEQQRLTIAQAFAEDDVIQEFSREKEDAVEKGKPKDIDLTLPGWGSWGGEGIQISKRKRKRLTIKAPPALPRKDGQLGHVIINESRMQAVSKHRVHDIPFPYTNVEQFEKSIRAPLGKTWNPQAVHKELVKPRVVTSLGKVIQPMHKSEVSKYEKNKAKSNVNLKSDSGQKNKNMEKSKKPVKRLDKQAKGNLKGQHKKQKITAKHAGSKR